MSKEARHEGVGLSIEPREIDRSLMLKDNRVRNPSVISHNIQDKYWVKTVQLKFRSLTLQQENSRGQVGYKKKTTTSQKASFPFTEVIK